MILHELVLYNYGVFRDRQVLKFAPPAPARPITLIGGLNGGGKTTLLEALHLSLYGPLAPVSGRRGLSYEGYLGRMVHYAVDPAQGAAVELAFSTQVSGASQTFRIRRSWNTVEGRLREHLEIARDGRFDRDLTDRWAEQVESFVPRGVAPFFFFDAEQVESLADVETSSELLRTAVGALLGLDLVDRLQRDLIVLERRKRTARLSTPAQAEIAGLEGEIEEMGRTESRAHQEEVAARARLERVRSQLEDAEQRFRREGGELFERRHDFEEERTRLANELQSTESDLREVAAGPACLLMVLDHLDAAAARATHEIDAQREHALWELLQERDAALLGRLCTMSSETLEAIERALAEDRASRLKPPVDLVLNLSGESVLQLRGLLDATLPQERARLVDLEGRRSRLRSELDLVEQRLAAVPAPDAMEGLVEELAAGRGELTAAESSYRDAEGRLAEVQRDRAGRARRLEQVLESTAHERLAEDDARRVVAHSGRVRETLTRFRVEATRRHLARIERLILESLGQLLRKDRLVHGIRLDPETFELELTGQNGQLLDPRKLSAGERQLFAISMLWGLARCSGRPLPVVIDTPLGRLDAAHRIHLLERYFPRASHQVVLLATDDEIDAPAFERLKSHIGRSCELRFDDARAATRIVDGYFWEAGVS